jgi:phosphoribosylanthranilate isomerase
VTRVKVCGIQSLEDLRLAAVCEADAVGFVVEVPGSRRSIDSLRARDLISKTPPFMTSVAVVAPQDAQHAAMLAGKTRADVLQVHGLEAEELEELKDLIPQKLVAAVPAKEGALEEALDLCRAAHAMILDSYQPGKLGGTGIAHDWSLSAQVRERVEIPLILAGGLTPENVAQAISVVRPYAVDVSSGVETSGKKDGQKIAAFVKEVRACSTP